MSNVEQASKDLDEFVAKTEQFCRDNRMDFRIENGRIYVYKYFYDNDGAFTSIKKIIDTTPF